MADTDGQETEAERVYRMRLIRALDAGLPVPVAERFAETLTADLHRLEDLVAGGCRPITAARILI